MMPPRFLRSLPPRFDPEAIERPELQQLHEHWSRIRGERGFPHRSALNPADLRFCLGHLAVAEIEREPFRVRYRLVGTRLVELYGRDVTNRYVDELYSRLVRQEAMSAYRFVADTAQPLYSKRIFNFLVKKWGYHRLMLPFSWRGEGVDLVLVGIYPTDEALRRAEDWRNLEEVKALEEQYRF